MSPDQLKSFYNGHFFKDNQPIEAHLVITFQVGEEVVEIPGVKVSPNVTLESIFKAYHQFLLKSENGDAPAQAEASKPVVDITIITYRGKEYILDVLAGEEFVVRRKVDGVVIKENSPLARGVVKGYKNSH